MDVPTIFGFSWKVAKAGDFAAMAITIAAVIVIFILIKVILSKITRDNNARQLFLFKMKRSGLSNFQIKIINNMVNILNLKNPNQIFENSEFFEDAIGKFLLYLREQHEKDETLAGICRDISITYSRLYHKTTFKKPLDVLEEIEDNQLLYFRSETGHVYLGKIISKEPGFLYVKLFRSPRELRSLGGVNNIKVYIWRLGDAEYVFDSNTAGLDNNVVTIEAPEKFTRANEFRHPYLSLILPVVLEKVKKSADEQDEKNSGSLIKINDYEAVIRLDYKIESKNEYFTEFDLHGFKFRILSGIIGARTFEERGGVYYTIKFIDMSEEEKTVLKGYISENL